MKIGSLGFGWAMSVRKSVAGPVNVSGWPSTGLSRLTIFGGSPTATASELPASVACRAGSGRTSGPTCRGCRGRPRLASSSASSVRWYRRLAIGAQRDVAARRTPRRLRPAVNLDLHPRDGPGGMPQLQRSSTGAAQAIVKLVSSSSGNRVSWRSVTPCDRQVSWEAMNRFTHSVCLPSWK